MFDNFIKTIFSGNSELEELKTAIISSLNTLKDESKGTLQYPLFEFKDSGNKILLYCLYDEDIMKSDAYKKFLGYTIVKQEDADTVNVDIENKYMKFAEITLQEQQRLSGYVVNLVPSSVPYNQDFIMQILQLLLKKIQNSLLTVTNEFKTKYNKDVILDAHAFINPLQESFHESFYASKFYNDVFENLQVKLESLLVYTFNTNMYSGEYLRPGELENLNKLIYTYIKTGKDATLKEYIYKELYRLHNIYYGNFTKRVYDESGEHVANEDIIKEKPITEFYTLLDEVLDNIKNSESFKSLKDSINSYLSKTKSDNVEFIAKDSGIQQSLINVISEFQSQLKLKISEFMSGKSSELSDSSEYDDLNYVKSDLYNAFKKIFSGERFEEDDSNNEPLSKYEKENNLFFPKKFENDFKSEEKDTNTQEPKYVNKSQDIDYSTMTGQERDLAEQEQVEDLVEKGIEDTEKDVAQRGIEFMSEDEQDDDTQDSSIDIEKYKNFSDAPLALQEEFFKQNPDFSYDANDDIYYMYGEYIDPDTFNYNYYNWLDKNKNNLSDVVNPDNQDEESNESDSNDSNKKGSDNLNVEEMELFEQFKGNISKVKRTHKFLKELYNSMKDLYNSYESYLKSIKNKNISEEQKNKLDSSFIQRMLDVCKAYLPKIEVEPINKFLRTVISNSKNFNAKSILDTISFLEITLYSIVTEIVEPKETTRGISQRLKSAIRHFRKILTDAYDNILPTKPLDLIEETSLELSHTFRTLSKNFGEDNLVTLFNSEYNPSLRIKDKVTFSGLSNLDEKMYSLKSMNDIFNTFNIDIDGQIYKFNSGKNDFVTDSGNNLKDLSKKVAEGIDDKDMREVFLNTLDNQNDYKKFIELLVSSIYTQSFGDMLSSGIENRGSQYKARTWNELTKFMNSLQEGNGAIVYIQNTELSEQIKTSLNSIITNAKEKSIKELTKYIDDLYNKFIELTK